MGRNVLRIFECFVIILNFFTLGRVLLFGKGLTRINLILLGASSIATALHLLLEGYRWQMIPAYTVLLLVILLIFISPNKYTISTSVAARIFKIGFISLYLAISVALPLIVPIFTFDKPTGSYEIGTKTYHFIDEKRPEAYIDNPEAHRELMVQLWYPAETGSKEPTAPYITHSKELASGLVLTRPFPASLFEYLGLVKTHSHQGAMLSREQTAWPLLIFSHGMDQFRGQNTFQMEELASHGYIVAAIDHTYDAAATVFPDGRTALSRSQLDEGLSVLDKHIPLWVEDVKFVLDKMEKFNDGDSEDHFRGAIDMERIGMIGHSYGGATAMQILMEDERVKAGINMDGGLYGKPAPKEGLSKPFMFMKADDADQYLQAAKEQSDISMDIFKQVWDELERRTTLAMTDGGYSLMIPHTNHMSYTDFPLYSPLMKEKGENVRFNHQRINDVSLTFFNNYVKGDHSITMEEISKRYPEINLIKH